MSNYYEVTATLDDYDEILFGSYILAEAKSELYEVKPSAKRDGYKNIRIEKLYCPADENDVPTRYLPWRK